MTKYIKFQNSVNSRRSSLVALIPPDLFHSCTVMFICTDRNDSNCKWLWQLLLSGAGCIMFLARQIYLAQIYGIMIAATLTACALTGTFVTCYSDISHHRLLCGYMNFFFLIHNRAGPEGGTIASSSFAGEEALTARPSHSLLTSDVGQRSVTVHSCALEAYKGQPSPWPVGIV